MEEKNVVLNAEENLDDLVDEAEEITAPAANEDPIGEVGPTAADANAVPEEAAVPADLGEIEREEAKADPKPATINNRSRRGSNRAQNERNAENQEQTRNVLNTVGTRSDDLRAEDSMKKSAKEIEEDNFKKLQTYLRNREILWGTVYAVEETDAWEHTIVIAVLYNGVKVSIPDFAYFESNYDFGANYASMSEEQKMRRRQVVAQYQLGARVCFTLMGVDRRRIESGQFENDYMIDAAGSRVDAMALMRDIWFLHKNRKSTSGTPRSVNVGDITDARILAVREDHVLVECLGVETRIDARNLCNDIVYNCNDVVQPGDVIRVRVRRCYVNNNDRIYLSVSGRLNDPSKAINAMNLPGWFLGHVDSYNAEKNTYTIMLKNGVQAAVRGDSVEGGIDLMIGDRVKVYVFNSFESFVTGRAVKM